jgi:hypothetical protein
MIFMSSIKSTEDSHAARNIPLQYEKHYKKKKDAKQTVTSPLEVVVMVGTVRMTDDGFIFRSKCIPEVVKVLCYPPPIIMSDR